MSIYVPNINYNFRLVIKLNLVVEINMFIHKVKNFMNIGSETYVIDEFHLCFTFDIKDEPLSRSWIM